MNKRCMNCFDRYYPKADKCVQVDGSCGAYNPQNGACLTCKSGFILQGSSCILGQSNGSFNQGSFNTPNQQQQGQQQGQQQFNQQNQQNQFNQQNQQNQFNQQQQQSNQFQNKNQQNSGNNGGE